ncbi:MAG: CDP-alcohol phosphatidyltransferase family protein [Balneolaceae bacterium]|nr:CDP-alcohol phosphatidyltransferase family protein [Balneolaceae bacterium]
MEKTKNIDGKKIQVKQTLFTWSNLISLSRVFIAVPVIYIHYQNGQQVNGIVTVLIIYAFLSDYLDGFVARKLDEISEWGKILDPIADKLSAFLLFVYTVYIGLIPLWFLIIEVARDALILCGSAYIKSKHEKVAMAVMSGKWSVNALAAYWMSAFFFPELINVQYFFMGISLTLMFLSLIDYFQRFLEIQKGAEFN